MIDPARLDLNLFIVFDALMHRRSVTGAAETLGVGQPAASAALKRLRRMCGDPLFVRGGGGLAPTPRALALAPVVTRALRELRAAVAEQPFEPASAERTFRVAASDSIAAVVMPDVLHRLARDAKGVRLALVNVAKRHVTEALERGEVDVALGHFPDLTGPLRVRRLYLDELVCVFDPKACGVGGAVTIDDFTRLPHLLVSGAGDFDGVADAALAALGRDRRTVMILPYFLALPFFLHGMAVLACAPRRLAERCVKVTNLALSPAPLKLPPVEVRIAWAERLDRDPGVAWLRGAILDAAARPGAR